jgi:sialate O-acetylesterase
VSATRSDSDVVVKFAGKDGRLSVYDALDASSFELCSAEATAVTWVRFCRGDSPLCNLYDGSGLPIGPFEFDIE